MKSWHSNSLLQHPLSAPLLLVAVILAVYYPALLSGIHPVDDPGILAHYSTSPPISAILLPGNGYYYRPILELSFYLDNLLWGMEPGIMHLENILLHCANGLIVFLLAARRLGGASTAPTIHIIICRSNTLIPLLAALLFALHPVNVEAVAWIAGRTDLLLTLFILSSCFFWLRWIEKPCWQDITGALLLFAAALLTKETALAFGVVALLLVLVWPGSATVSQRYKAIAITIAPVVLIVILALVLRKGTNGLSRFLSGADLQFVQSTWQALIALGFYVRKVVFPFPLNFAINVVHPLNGIFVLALFPFFWWVFRQYRRSGVFFTAALLLVMPALLIAVKQIAWTPFAERYLYLSTAFVALGLVGICEEWKRKCPVLLRTFFVVLLCGSAIFSFQRNLLWKNPLSFFEDAVAKSPEFGSVYHSLGGLLLQQGEVDRASEAFITADRLNKRASMRDLIRSSIMGAMLARGNNLEARIYFFQLYKNKKAAPDVFLDLLYKADGKRFESMENDGKAVLAQDMLETIGLLYLRKPDPFLLYQSGKIALAIGKKNEAADFFRRAYSTAPPDAHFKAAAKTYFLRLDAGK